MNRMVYLLIIIGFVLMVRPLSAAPWPQPNWQPNHATVSFSDITWAAGVGGPGGDQAGGHGAMWADVTEDGYPDLYMPFNWQPDTTYHDRFYRNNGNGTFTEEAIQRGIADPDGGSHGAAWVDLDNDGDFDLINGTTYADGGWHGTASNNIFRNNGYGYFSDVTPAALKQRTDGTRAFVALDFDRDGDQDLFGVTGSEGSIYPAERNELYRNNGGFDFAAVNWGAAYTAPAGQGAIPTDYDGDGDTDLLVANRNGAVNVLQNHWGNFTAVNAGQIGLAGESDSVSAADIDNDGDLDLLLTKDNEARLYRNWGAGSFKQVTTFHGIDGYMGGFADLDNDGDVDLVFPGHQNIYLNDGYGNFHQTAHAPINNMADPRSVAFADIDNDGDLDFIVGGKKQPNRLIRNNYWGDNHWLKLNLIASNGQTGAFGAKVFVYADSEQKTMIGMREARSNTGYLAQDDPTLHIGLGQYSQVTVKVVFVDGKTIVKEVSADQTIIIDGRNLKPTLIDLLDDPLQTMIDALDTITIADVLHGVLK